MTEKIGVKNILKPLDLLLETGNLLAKALEDGKFSTTDIAIFFGLLDEVTGLSGVDWKAIPKEIKDIDAAELDQIKDHINKKLEIPQKDIELVTERIISSLVSLAIVGLEIYDIVKIFQKK